MANIIGRNVNCKDTATITSVTLNATTSTTILAANDKRIAFHVNNDDSSVTVWIKLQAASVDNDKKGIFLNKKALVNSQWEMTPDNIYVGEISAIADTGTPTVYITEY